MPLTSPTQKGRGRRRIAPASLVAFALLLLGLPAHAGSCNRGVTIATFPEGAPIKEIVFDAKGAVGGYDFSTVYLHSVTLTPVESRYRIVADTIRQTAELFQQHGPGLASEASDRGSAWHSRDGWFLVETDRSFEKIVMRVSHDYRNRLTVGDKSYDLTLWGDRALELRPIGCR